MMKRLLWLAACGVLVAGCSSANKEADYSIPRADQIVDQEFDNMQIPNDNYNRVAPYEDQITGSSYIQSTSGAKKSTNKPARSMATQKTVVDQNGRILSSDTPAGITDQEALPDERPTGDAAL